jgi:hypothetical protein
MRLSTVYSNIISTRRSGTPTHAEVRDDLARAMAARFVSPFAR